MILALTRHTRGSYLRKPSRKIVIGESLLLIAAVLGAAYFIGHLLSFEYGRDQGIYALVADAILQGKTPYQDVWDFKPPGIFFFFALARFVFGTGMYAVRILEALALVSLFFAFLILSQRHVADARPGIIGGLAAVFSYVAFDFWHTAQPESIGCVVLAWALVCATYDPADSAGRCLRWLQMLAWVSAAALYAVAALLKPPLGGGFMVSMVFIMLSRWRRLREKPWPVRIGPPLLAFALGGALPMLAVLAYFTGKGALGDLYDVLFVFVPNYTMLDFQTAQLPLLLLKALYQWLFYFSPYIAIGFLLFFMLPALHKREREAALHVLGVIVFALVGVALQAKFFEYHFGAAVPLAGLLVGWGFWKLWIRVRQTIMGWFVVGLILCVAGVFWTLCLPNAKQFWARCSARISAWQNPDRLEAIHDRIYSRGDMNAGANRRAARWIEKHTPPGSSIYIWGFEPIIYDLAHRQPASRYIYNVPQRVTWGREEARRVLLTDLMRSDPAAVVIVRRDAIPWVTGNEKDSNSALADFPELLSWIKEGYEHARTFEDLKILLRRK